MTEAEEIKIQLFDLQKKLNELSREQSDIWSECQRLQIETDRKYAEYQDKSFEVSSLYKEIRALETRLNGV